jgi:hypothetical protein
MVPVTAANPIFGTRLAVRPSPDLIRDPGMDIFRPDRAVVGFLE